MNAFGTASVYLDLEIGLSQVCDNCGSTFYRKFNSILESKLIYSFNMTGIKITANKYYHTL